MSKMEGRKVTLEIFPVIEEMVERSWIYFRRRFARKSWDPEITGKIFTLSEVKPNSFGSVKCE